MNFVPKGPAENKSAFFSGNCLVPNKHQANTRNNGPLRLTHVCGIRPPCFNSGMIKCIVDMRDVGIVVIEIRIVLLPSYLHNKNPCTDKILPHIYEIRPRVW